MPFPGAGFGRGGGGGLHFRNPVDVFADVAARTAAFGTGGSVEGEHVQFAADRTLAIVIGTLANPTNFQTYTGGPGTYDDALWLNRTDAVQGRPGTAGAPGGGAWSSLGSDVQTADDHAANVFVDSGIDLPADRSVFGYRLAGSQNDLDVQAGIMPISVALLEGKARASAGDTSAAASRIRLPEYGGGGSIGGNIYAGLTAARRLLLATSNANQDWAVEFFDYVPSAAQGGLDEAEVDARIAPYARAAPSGQIADAQIPAAIARDSEIPGNTEIDARIAPYARAAPTGQIADAQIPAAIARDSEVPTEAEIDARVVAGTKAYARTGGGQVPDGDIPAGIARDSEVPTEAEIDARVTAGTKVFAQTGGRGVRVGDMDSESATDGQVATADGAMGVAWEDQTGGTPVQDHTNRAAVSADNSLEQTEIDNGTTSDTNQITLPTWTGNRFVFVGVPEAEDDITDIAQGGLSQFGGWQRVAGLIDGHKWWRTNVSQSDLLSGQTLTLTLG